MSERMMILMILVVGFAVGYAGFLWSLGQHSRQAPQCRPHRWERYGDEMDDIKCLDCGCQPKLNGKW